MKKILLVLMLVFGGLILVSCTDPIGKEIEASEVGKNYALGAITSSSLLSEFDGGSMNRNLYMSNKSRNGDNDSLVKNQLETITKYMNIFDEMLTDHSETTIVMLESDLKEYETKIRYTTKIINGEATVYEIYLNETIVENTRPIIHPNNPNKEKIEEKLDKIKHKWDFASNETTTKIEGIMKFGDITYQLSGTKEVEEVNNELEIEIEFISKLSDGNYVKMQYEFEEETDQDEFETEKTWKYDVYQDHKLVNRTKISQEIEIENDEREETIKMVIIEGRDEQVFKFNKEIENNEEKMKFSYKITKDGKTEEGQAKIKLVTIDNIEYYQYKIETSGSEEEIFYVEKNSASLQLTDPTPLKTTKIILEQTITKANTIITDDASKYTSTSLKVLSEAVEKAIIILNDDLSSQDTIDQVVITLNNIIDTNLVLVGNKSELEGLVLAITQTHLEENYTIVSYQDLKELLVLSTTLLSNPDALQTELDDMTNHLQEKVELLIKLGDKTSLNAQIAGFLALDKELYEETSYQAVQDMILGLATLLEDNQATELAVNEASSLLETQINNLVLITQ